MSAKISIDREWLKLKIDKDYAKFELLSDKLNQMMERNQTDGLVELNYQLMEMKGRVSVVKEILQAAATDSLLEDISDEEENENM